MAAKQEWLVVIPDNANVLEKRMEVRPKHLEAIKPNVSSGTIVFGGATLESEAKEGESPRSNGSAMVIVAETKEAALDVVKSDVYVANGVWDLSKMQVYPFKSAVRTAM